MNKLTDLEICKRIAEIEGFEFDVLNGRIHAKPFTVTEVFSCAHVGFIFNPLTDDALCFQLMVKHGITVQKSTSVINGRMEWNGKYYATHPRSNGFGSIDESPNKAVCLEKIEVHNE
ncbi:MAG: hypothetical protein GY804_11970 [Alphaproteobacteria bacterium]|nr:hypothetical protein [Alphaproteobacteria bacterium]